MVDIAYNLWLKYDYLSIEELAKTIETYINCETNGSTGVFVNQYENDYENFMKRFDNYLF